MKPANQMLLMAVLLLAGNSGCMPDYYSESLPVSLCVVSTFPASEITSSTANLGIEIISTGNLPVTESGMVYATTPNPTVMNSKVRFSSRVKAGQWTVTLSGLSPATTYYARAYATNCMGTSYGLQETFSSCPENTLPTVITFIAEYGVNATKFLSGQVTANGSTPVIARGFVYATTPNPTESDSKITVEFDPESYGVEIFQNPLTGFIPGMTYYVRAFAINSVGTAFGNQVIILP